MTICDVYSSLCTVGVGGADHDLGEKEEAGTQVIAGWGGRDLSGQSIGCVFHHCWEELWVSRVQTAALRSTRATLLNNHSYQGLCASQMWGQPWVGGGHQFCCHSHAIEAEMALKTSVVSWEESKLGTGWSGSKSLLHQDLGCLCIYVFLLSICLPMSICLFLRQGLR